MGASTTWTRWSAGVCRVAPDRPVASSRSEAGPTAPAVSLAAGVNGLPEGVPGSPSRCGPHPTSRSLLAPARDQDRELRHDAHRVAALNSLTARRPAIEDERRAARRQVTVLDQRLRAEMEHQVEVPIAVCVCEVRHPCPVVALRDWRLAPDIVAQRDLRDVHTRRVE